MKAVVAILYVLGLGAGGAAIISLVSTPLNIVLCICWFSLMTILMLVAISLQKIIDYLEKEIKE